MQIYVGSTEQNGVCGKVLIINSKCTLFSIAFGIKKKPKTNSLKKKICITGKMKLFFQKSKSHKGSLLRPDGHQQDT